MPKVKLQTRTLWSGVWYESGDAVEVPEDLAQALGLKSQLPRSPSNKTVA